MLCITVAKNSIVNTYINLDKCEPISGSDELKMLGFHFGCQPTADTHVNHICRKFWSKMWILRHLKNANVSRADLCKIYCTYLRPVIEYASNVYHCLLTKENTETLEDMQKAALKLIYGNCANLREIMKETNICTLQEQRSESFKKSAQKSLKNERFKNLRFPLKETERSGLRKTEKFAITHSKYDRLKNGSLNTMRRILNE